MNKSSGSEDPKKDVSGDNIEISKNENSASYEDSVDKNELIYKINVRNKKLMSVQIMWIVMMGVTFVLTVLQIFLYVRGVSAKD